MVEFLLLGLYDWVGGRIRRVLTARYGKPSRAIARQARQEFKLLIRRLPDIGGLRNSRMQLVAAAALFLALYRPLRARGIAVEEIGAVIGEVVGAAYDAFPPFLLRLYGGLYFTRSAVRRAEKAALGSQERRYAGDWVFRFVAGNGEFDWGVDYVECGIIKFFQREGAEEFTPTMCGLDWLASERFGWGLQRTCTLASGGERCDFRFRRAARDD